MNLVSKTSFPSRIGILVASLLALPLTIAVATTLVALVCSLLLVISFVPVIVISVYLAYFRNWKIYAFGSIMAFSALSPLFSLIILDSMGRLHEQLSFETGIIALVFVASTAIFFKALSAMTKCEETAMWNRRQEAVCDLALWSTGVTAVAVGILPQNHASPVHPNHLLDPTMYPKLLFGSVLTVIAAVKMIVKHRDVT